MKKALSLLLSLTLVFTLLASSAAAEAALPIIKIASVTPLSGSQAAMGETIKNGIELALNERVEEFKALGFDLQFSPQDDQADPKVGVSVAQRLIEDKDILAVIGHWNSGVAIPSSEVYNQGGLAMVSPANTAIAVTDRGLPVVNRICARDDAQGPAGADFLFSLGLTSVYIIQDKTAYGQGVADEFKKRFEAIGGTVLGYEGITAGEADYSAVEEMIRASGAQAVYFGGIYPEGGLIIKQLQEKGIAVTFLGPDGMDSAELVNIAGDAVIGTYYTSTAADVSGTEKGAAFAANYNAKYGHNPEGYAAYGYDAVNVALDAIKSVITANPGVTPTREQVATAIRATSGYQGMATNVTFNSIGDNTEATVYVLGFKEAKYPAEVIKAIPVKDYLK
ncbi:MAG TPA: branched-chain amino acid ABC transporter substrate-binding protein [Candidatus Limiplasma sp.]|nr:branched-chain amino acid ABC transporter substrate-binding protein [Candidatus Limiplasma sp.]HPS81726.1 branched-chain amino acid ABC transporter substrate-binding protein [Candidatus Limiplasma sp.]